MDRFWKRTDPQEKRRHLVNFPFFYFYTECSSSARMWLVEAQIILNLILLSGRSRGQKYQGT